MRKLIYILLLLPIFATAQTVGIKVATPIIKNNPVDNTITGYAHLTNGATTSYPTKASIDSLVNQFSATLRTGMSVYVIATDSTYRLQADNTWLAVSPGSVDGSYIKSGGTTDITSSVTVNTGTTNQFFAGDNSGYKAFLQVVAPPGIASIGSAGALGFNTITTTPSSIAISALGTSLLLYPDSATFKSTNDRGIRYYGDYSTSFTDRHIPDVGWVKNNFYIRDSTLNINKNGYDILSKSAFRNNLDVYSKGASDGQYMFKTGAVSESVDGFKTFTYNLAARALEMSSVGASLDAGQASVSKLLVASALSDRTRGVAYYTYNIKDWEAGERASKNYMIDRYDAAGALIDSPFLINKATGIIKFQNSLQMGVSVGSNTIDAHTSGTTFSGFSSGALNPTILQMARSTGTPSSPTIPSSAVSVGVIQGLSYLAPSTYGVTSQIRLGLDAVPTTTSSPGNISFETTAAGTTAPTVHATLNSVGNWGFKTTVPTHTITLGSTATGFVHYNTSDQTTNYERVRLSFSGNVFNIASEVGGTGTLRNLSFGNGASKYEVGNVTATSSGHELRRDNTSLTNIAAVASSAMLSSSGTQNLLALYPTISQTSIGGYRGIYLAVYESSTGSGAKELINLGTTTAANGGGTFTSKFKVDNAGVTTVTSSLINTNTAAGTAGADSLLVKVDANNEIKRIAPNYYQTAITFGTGVQSALGVNIGGPGAPVVYNGALGTPSSGVATNLTGTAPGLTAGAVTNGVYADSYQLKVDADFNVNNPYTYYKLPTITTNRVASLPSGSTFLGTTVKIHNTYDGTGGFNWSFGGVTVKDATGATLTTLSPNTLYVLEYIPTDLYWLKIN